MNENTISPKRQRRPEILCSVWLTRLKKIGFSPDSFLSIYVDIPIETLENYLNFYEPPTKAHLEKIEQFYNNHYTEK